LIKGISITSAWRWTIIFIVFVVILVTVIVVIGWAIATIGSDKACKLSWITGLSINVAKTWLNTISNILQLLIVMWLLNTWLLIAVHDRMKVLLAFWICITLLKLLTATVLKGSLPSLSKSLTQTVSIALTLWTIIVIVVVVIVLTIVSVCT